MYSRGFRYGALVFVNCLCVNTQSYVITLSCDGGYTYVVPAFGFGAALLNRFLIGRELVPLFSIGSYVVLLSADEVTVPCL